METIYLLQPFEYIGSNTYKFGCSTKNDLSRCKNGYKLGTRFLCIFECINSHILENKIKIQFNKLFKLIKGREYFEGNEKQIYEEFIRLVGEHKNITQYNKNIIDDTHHNEDKPKIDSTNIIDDKYNDDKPHKIYRKEYVCDICKKTWKNKTDFTRHKNKKNPCKIRKITIGDKINLLTNKINELEDKMDKLKKIK